MTRGYLLAAALAAVLAVSGASVRPAEAETQSDLRSIFQDLLQEPDSVDLNMRYARAAEQLGEHRKAITAYERVLLANPDNAEAAEGLRRVKRQLEPGFTTVTVSLGAAYHSNPRQLRDRDGSDDDVVLSGRALVVDERRLGGLRFRSNGALYADAHINFNQLDFGYIGADTGPLLELGGGWLVRPALGAAYAWLDSETLFWEGSLLLNFESDHKGAFQKLDLRFSYDKIGHEFSQEDGFIVEVSPRFLFPRLLFENDALSVRPLYRFNGASGDERDDRLVLRDLFPEQYHQLGGRVDYYFPIGEDGVFGAVNLVGNHRFYAARVPFESERRRDTFLAPGAQLIFPDVVVRDHDIVLRYTYQWNLSNDGAENFQNHIAGINSVWKF